MVSVVNGFVCQSGCDEAVARKGRDPRNPKNDPAKAEALAIRDGKASATDEAAAGTRASEIVSFGKDQSTVAASAETKDARRNPASPALFYDRSA